MEQPDNNGSVQSPDSSNLSFERDHGGDNGHETGHENGQQPSLTPPHWSHRRRESYASVVDNKPAPITLEDHTEGPLAAHDAVWAKAIYIEDYVIVSGGVKDVGSFVVWHCKIDTLEGGAMVIRKRYSEFHELKRKLLVTFPNSAGAMPLFPPKSMIREHSISDNGETVQTLMKV
ncbi:uncharacterized protein KY384_008558 [Bacidia gigantensis]|uniref:uncharacterized protein n=1 Tax=Bacidia gigantensis TaxID=2732470 RepID=UPI001D03FD0A|nr:uncharacterized protein KY384_008558 [Bacidia gigantensis]KAG8527129.1 hypothetical protein KY384_008558 [Bacidia gigantensis]